MEEIEEIIYNLCNNIEIISTNLRIDKYKKANKDVILKNKQKISKEEYELEMLLEQEKELIELRKKELQTIEVESKKKKTIEKEALIDELMFSNRDAGSIIQTFAKQAEDDKKETEAAVPPPTKVISNLIRIFRFNLLNSSFRLPSSLLESNSHQVCNNSIYQFQRLMKDHYMFMKSQFSLMKVLQYPTLQKLKLKNTIDI